MSELLQCPSCGGSNQLPEGKNSMFCAFCGNAIEKKVDSKVHVPKPEENPQIKNYLELAKNAEESDNYEEAINYYNKAIEFDLKLPEAWFGKGHCSGWSGNLRIIKINEMVKNFKKALEYSNEEDKEAMAKRIAKSIDGCSFAVYKLSYNHTVEFATVNGTYQEHLHRSIDVLDALEYAHTLDPSSKHILDSLVKISENLLTPIRYKDYDDNWGALKMDGGSQNKVNNIRIKYSTQLALLNPSYASEIEGKVQTGNIMFYIGIGGAVLAFILFKTDNVFYGIVAVIISIIVGFIGYRNKSNYEGVLEEIKNAKHKASVTKSKSDTKTSTSNSNNGNLHIKWNGQFFLMDIKTAIYVNDTLHSKQSTKKGFSVSVPITNGQMNIKLKLGPKSTTYNIPLDSSKDYILNLKYNDTLGKYDKKYDLETVE